MMKVTANGKTFTFPDGTSTEDIGTPLMSILLVSQHQHNKVFSNRQQTTLLRQGMQS